MPRAGQFNTSYRVDDLGRECSYALHVGERYLVWERYHNNKKGHKGKESHCKACKRLQQQTYYDRFRKKQGAWDVKGANTFLMGK